MTKITSAKIHKNDYASMDYYGVMNYSVKRIRRNIDWYRKSKKINTGILGSIHALRLLCENTEGFDIPIIYDEALEWKDIMSKWYGRIKNKIPEEIRDEFRDNLENDLDVIVSKGKKYPEYMWKAAALECEYVVTIPNRELLEKYEEIAEMHYSGLGGALHNYLNECLEKLLKIEPKEKVVSVRPEGDSLSPVFYQSKSNEFTYLLKDFRCFLTDQQKDESVEINAYDVEKAIKLFLSETDQSLSKSLRFDCESSLFSVQAKKMDELSELNNLLLKLVIDDLLKSKYFSQIGG